MEIGDAGGYGQRAGGREHILSQADRTSILTSFKLWVKPLAFNAGIGGSKLPTDFTGFLLRLRFHAAASVLM
ncbi:MAG: hypothetical protein LBB61_06140 [Treponema sp.]|nr:hypothetical protein [Treponema sp.]